MNKAKAKAKYVRISPRKARLAAGLIRGLPFLHATEQLHILQLKGGRLLKKTLDQRCGQCRDQLHNMRREDMIVHEVRVDEGPTMKRAKPKNRVDVIRL